MPLLPALYIFVSIQLAPEREGPSSTSGRFAYTGDKASPVSSYCSYVSAAGFLYFFFYTIFSQKRSPLFYLRQFAILGTRLLCSPPTAGMPVLPFSCIIVSIPLAPKTEVPDSTSGKFVYTGDQVSLVICYCSYASAAGSLYCFVYTTDSQKEVPGSISGMYSYTGDKVSLFLSYCRYASAAAF
jgi:hypothetical protein